MPSLVALLLLPAQVDCQQFFFPPVATNYYPQVPYPDPLQQQSAFVAAGYQYSPPPATYQFGQQPIGQQPIGQVQQYPAVPSGLVPAGYQPATKPLPSPEVIEQERDAYLKESHANAEAAMQKIQEEYETAKRTFLAEQEQAKQQYLANLEANEKRQLQDLENQLIARTREASSRVQGYASRLEKQAQDMIKARQTDDVYAEHKSKLDPIVAEERSHKEEFEQQIRAAYEATRYGGALSDPSGPIKEAKERFDQRMQALASKRNLLQAELQKAMASFYGN